MLLRLPVSCSFKSLGSGGEDGLIKSYLREEWFKLVCNVGVLLHTLGLHILLVLPKVVPGNLALAKSQQTCLAMTVALLEVIAFVFSLEAQPLGTLRSSLVQKWWKKTQSGKQLYFRPVYLQTAHV